MKIMVCIKQVIDSDAEIAVDDASVWPKTDERAEFHINRFDECALEEAVLMKDAHKDISVDVISVGPPRVSDALKRAMGMGCDHAIHIRTDTEGFLSPFVTASWIAAMALKKKYDLILTGMLSEDLMQGQVGPIISERLGLPCAVGIVHERLMLPQKKIYTEREIEGGARQRLEIDLPAVLAIQTGINQPRYPSLSNLLKANRYKIEIIDSASFAHAEPRQEVVATGCPRKTRAGRLLAGSQDEKARELYRILKKKALIL